MSEDLEPYEMIDSRPKAAAFAALAAWMTQIHIRHFIIHQAGLPHWLHAFDGILPHYTGIALSVLQWAIVCALLVQSVVHCRGAERVLFALLLSEGVVQPLRLLPAHIPMVILAIMIPCDVAMLAAAVRLFFTLRWRPQLDPPAD